MLRRLVLGVVPVLGCLSIAGCSQEEKEPDGRAGDIRANDSWGDVKITGTVQVFPGAVVEIQPGAMITCTPASKIVIGGTLRKAAGARSKISCEDWSGIVVAQGGVVDLDGIDLENPQVGIETTIGAGATTLKDATITNSLKPFLVGKQSKLTLTNVKATTPKTVADNVLSIGDVHGVLVASRLDYDAGPNEGISLKEGGEATIEDSVIHGTNGQDMISAYNAKRLDVSYSILSGAHCGPHIEGIEAFTIDHVTSENNTYGLTIYAAGAGPHVVRDSNVSGDAAWLDLQGEHGPITFENVYYSGGKEVIQNTAAPSLGTKPDAPIANAKPR
jgi:hypothetical protein